MGIPPSRTSGNPNKIANKNAREIVDNKKLNDDYKLLLKLFGKDESLKLIDAG